MTHHLITLDAASRDRTDSYGVLYISRNVYKTRHSHAPTRFMVWGNTNRPNRYLGHAPGDTVGEGQNRQVLTDWFLRTYPNALTAPWFDPHNEPTDSPVTFLLTTESSAICSNTNMNTGSPGSGQVYAQGEKLGDGDTATLSYPDGTTREVRLRFNGKHTGNGHGVAELA